MKAAETTNDTALAANATPAAENAYRTPPSAGPASCPTFEAAASVPFAHVRSASPAKFGTAAREAGPNGECNNAASAPSAIVAAQLTVFDVADATTSRHTSPRLQVIIKCRAHVSLGTTGGARDALQGRSV